MAERTARERAIEYVREWQAAWPTTLVDLVEHAIQAAILDEREQCARLCDEIGATYDHVTGIGTHGNELIEIRSIAGRIRARGEK